IMKLTTLNLLRGGVFSLAVVAAFAFTQPMPQYTMVWGYDSDLEDVFEVNIANDGTDYRCDSGVTTSCLYEDEELQQPIAGNPGSFK
ncbi:hypothetical protein ACWKSR_12035, partial [Campylobacter fetus subsp. venerealis]